MLPRHHKLTSSDQFRRAIKKGKRGGSRTVVVHLYDTATASASPAGSGHRRMYVASGTADISSDNLLLVRQGGPRCGLIVSKAVGNAVIRHRTSRRLRHILAKLCTELPAEYDLVVRALPAAAGASSAELEKDLLKAVAKSEKTL